MPHPDEFTIKITEIQQRGFDTVFNEAWEKALIEIGG